MEKEVKFIATFTVPILIRVAENTTPNADELEKSITDAAVKRINDGTTKPRIEQVYEAISEDEVGKNQIPGANDQRASVDNNVGTTGRQDPDINKEMRGDEQGPVERNDTGGTGQAGDEGQDRHKDEGRIQTDEAVGNGNNSPSQS
jgi:hypothetical protein